MYIDSPNFPRRKVFNAKDNLSYSPNKRWDQGIHGSERNQLAQHVAQTLKSHQKDAQILQKFRKEAANFKKQQLAQKFPTLQAKKNYRQKTPPSLNHIIVPRQVRHRQQQYSRRPSQFIQNIYQKKQQARFGTLNQLHPIKIYDQEQAINKFKDSFEKQKPYEKIIIKQVPVQSGFDMNMRMDYQRIIQKKNRQIEVKDERIRKRNHHIQKLQKKLMELERNEQLQKMVKEQDQLKSIKNMLTDLRQQVAQNGASFKKSLLQRANQRRNLSEVQLSRKVDYDFMNPQYNASQQLKTQSRLIQVQKNASIIYSPASQKKKSSFASSFKGKQILQKNLLELKSYNNRIDLLNNQ